MALGFLNTGCQGEWCQNWVSCLTFCLCQHTVSQHYTISKFCYLPSSEFFVVISLNLFFEMQFIHSTFQKGFQLPLKFSSMHNLFYLSAFPYCSLKFFSSMHNLFFISLHFHIVFHSILFIFNLLLQLTYNVLSVSAIQQSDPVILIIIYTFFFSYYLSQVGNWTGLARRHQNSDHTYNLEG